MSWSPTQQRVFMQAARAAGWNGEQRYIAMTHAGCPLLPGGGPASRPSVKHARNTQDQFEILMGLAEAMALTRGEGDNVPRPREGGFWTERAGDVGHRQRRAIEKIALEAVERMPRDFAPDFLAGFIYRMTHRDRLGLEHLGARRPRDLTECDEGQLYRIHEGLKAWVGRELGRHGMAPRSFTWHAGGRRESEMEAA